MKLFKNIVYGIVASTIAIFGMTSCSQEDMPDTPNREGMVDVVMSTTLPQGLQTYGVNSAEGGLKNLEDKDYLVRYIMEIYPKGSTTKVQRMIKYVPISSRDTYWATSFETRLLASEYNFVFFADIVRQVNAYPYNDPNPYPGLTTPYYANRYFFSNTDESSDVLIRPTDVNTAVAGDLQTICASKAATDTFQNPYLEMYDAYSCTKAVDLRTESTTQSFTLKRPFAKLRLITTDADQLLATPDWSKSRVDITVSDIPTGFNALSGASIAGTERGYWNGGIQALNSDVYSNEPDDGSEKTLSVFYLPVPAKSQNLTFSITVKDASGKVLTQSVKLEVENVPLVGNKLTTIKGNLLSKNATFNVTIDDEFEDDETIIEYGKEASTVDALKAAMTGKDETITYTGSVTAKDGFTLDFSDVNKPVTYADANSTPVYAEGNNTTLTLKFPSIEEGAVFTFQGTNAPKNLRIVTDTKCSLRLNLEGSFVYYDGAAYKYIVTNTGAINRRSTMEYDALFVVDGKGASFSSPVNPKLHHLVKLDANFNLPDGASCTKKHPDGTACDIVSTIQSWLNANSGKSVWDFVGDAKN